ncbi:MAG TPA: tol-pal system protein YbgF [Burkholderiaceae bacterium]|nr:tol-pal system protein YbgF [Burkholderiaceae bacterium]
MNASTPTLPIARAALGRTAPRSPLAPPSAGPRAAAAALAIALAGALAPAHAQLFSDDEARRAILDVRSRVDQLQRDLLKRIEDLSARIERLEQTTRGQFDLQNQIQAMRQEIAGLRGQLEVQTNELSKTQRSQRDLAADLDGRIKRFEPVAVNVDGRQVNVDPAERRAYDGALAIFRGGDFRGAQSAFQQFSAAYPQSPYGPNVQYWLGSSQYAQKDNKGAIATLQAFAQKYPDHPRAADAWLTVANAQNESGDRKAAAETFKLVVDRYDGSGAAQTARERLAALNAPAKR